MNIIIPFTSPSATLENSGGKGANLARLTRTGFDVPPGFIVSTDAYRAFVAGNGLETAIPSALENLPGDDPAALEAASAQIRAAFAAGKMPGEIESALRSAYAARAGAAVAVRSSATAEDLPDLSFAGQQDTYLNIIGEAQVLRAVVDCWSSLWTARAIGYRVRNGIAQDSVELAVIVQEMVQSEVSGVLFTANPLTGLRSESVIDATFGLGEALVSGQVEPDHYVVDCRGDSHPDGHRRSTPTVVAKTLGAKKIATRSVPGGGVESVHEDAGVKQTLSDNEISLLVATGQTIQKEYGSPQDIEWAFARGKLYILQSRPITSLFPIPDVGAVSAPLQVWFSFGAVQGRVGPMTPLGQDAIRHVAAAAGRLFGAQIDPTTFKLFVPAGERIWVNESDMIRNPIGSRVMGWFLAFIEPSIGQIMGALMAEPRIGAGRGRVKPRTLWRLARFFVPVAARLAGNMLHPEAARARFDAVIEDRLAAARIAPAADRFGRLANVIAFMRENMASALAFLLPKFIPVFGPSMGALGILEHFSPQRAMDVTRGLPRNVTTEMDLALWKTAQAIGADAAAGDVFRESAAPELARRYLEGSLPAAAQAVISSFLEKYGMRGVGEIDFGQRRWREDPTPVMHTLQSYLQISPEFAPDVVFAKGEKGAEETIEQIVAEVRQQPGGWLKEKVVRAAAKRIRLLMGARESPKFFAIRTMGIARKALLEVGQEFVEAGTIDRADDLVFLRLAELDEISGRGGSYPGGHKQSASTVDWKILIAERRASYERELRRRQVPRVLVSDGRTFYEGLGAATDTGNAISGSPVSPGVVEGRVHVVLDPRGTQLAPGEILVCPGTDPAWTPLFMAAGGLVMEVGGMMTHGSVVAREYGIPAVVGVHEATLRLKDGQRIRVDGSTGKIVVLD